MSLRAFRDGLSTRANFNFFKVVLRRPRISGPNQVVPLNKLPRVHMHGEWMLLLVYLTQGGHTNPAFSIVFVLSAPSIYMESGCCSLRLWHREVTQNQRFLLFMFLRPQAYAWGLGVVPYALGTGRSQKPNVFDGFCAFGPKHMHGDWVLFLAPLAQARGKKPAFSIGFYVFGPKHIHGERMVFFAPLAQGGHTKPKLSMVFVLSARMAREPEGMCENCPRRKIRLPARPPGGPRI